MGLILDHASSLSLPVLPADTRGVPSATDMTHNPDRAYEEQP